VISFITPWRSDEYRAVLFKWVHARVFALYPDAEYVTCDSPDEDGVFNRGRSINLAAKSATGDILVFLDADTVFSHEAFARGLLRVRQDKWILPYTIYYNLNAKFTRYQLEREPGEDLLFVDTEYEYKFPSVESPVPAVSGRVMVSREAFDKSGGYDENFKGWGLEDRVFAMQLEHDFGPPVRVAGSLYHLYHPAPAETCFGQPYFEQNRALYHQHCLRLGVEPIC
jgi:predicted glycosyltransferase involved in capsule biosynthesis